MIFTDSAPTFTHLIHSLGRILNFGVESAIGHRLRNPYPKSPVKMRLYTLFPLLTALLFATASVNAGREAGPGCFPISSVETRNMTCDSELGCEHICGIEFTYGKWQCGKCTGEYHYDGITDCIRDHEKVKCKLCSEDDSDQPTSSDFVGEPPAVDSD
ncbi:hypothetical protein PCANC_20536 [Puccinia coronata f. sp. avenae]|uniref:Uncharacterized protein n=1 Tax=Puccinia coronata f. sp. avenae TaxID=200324 RepID=A0A2N5U5K7_9BASI|nr:hypothetical protein PCANC_20536 [Puccinia coronata f. sp. avenae]PLW47429.1 hypothetical protein PCASD_04399 [Puccinia coronata f. sp. avenae]